MFMQLSLLVTCLLFAFANALKATTQNVLVLYDSSLTSLDNSTLVTPEVSKFINYLQEQFTVTLEEYNNDESSVYLFEDNEQESARYQHLVLFPTSKKSFSAKSNITQHTLMKFIDKYGGNVISIGDENSVLPNGIRSFLNELGIYPSPKNYRYIDHFNSGRGSVSLNSAENLVPGNRLVESLDNVEYNGSGALISNNEFIFPIIKSSSTGYTGKAGEKIEGTNTWTFGEQGYLAVGLQALNNARVAWLGSTDLLEFENIYKWAFQKQGVLKLQYVEHYNQKNVSAKNPHLYRINNEAVYTIGVSELIDGKWVPYKVAKDEDQFQLSFKLLDPYQRLNLISIGPSDSEDGPLTAQTYRVNFTVPDHHGMFTFELDYKRVGLSYLQDKRVVTVRHLANDEFKRSWDITNAWLYIASLVIVIGTWFLFVVSYIYVGNTNYQKKNE
ncbi:Dolichyl-diphosphooligosaccharide--protein glycosyltransferase subunit WBP1 [Spathaspora sp. JA1]|nr:Dolichyl-diphosphooligosaccharide--protein glycosyltransferase subunit WBP1 [Spathaspora sp. JA1]